MGSDAHPPKRLNRGKQLKPAPMTNRLLGRLGIHDDLDSPVRSLIRRGKCSRIPRAIGAHREREELSLWHSQSHQFIKHRQRLSRRELLDRRSRRRRHRSVPMGLNTN